tara:strand:- start:2181 stop:3098 length:918 start_codon:yes stop_codon:yes gene_type:complete
MGGSSKPPSTVKSIQDLPAWSKPYWQNIASKGRRISDDPFVEYTGQKTARFNPMETMAFQGVQSMYDEGPRKELGAAQGIASQAAARGFDTPQWSAQAYQQYANPYLEQVMEPGRRRLREEAQEALGLGRMGARDQGFASGIVGGRSNLSEARVAKDISDTYLQNLSEYEAAGRDKAYTQAMDAFYRQGDADRAGTQMAMDAGNQLRQLASDQQSQAFQRIEALKNAGLSQRELEQEILNQARADFREKEDFKRQQLNWFAGLLSGTPYNVTNQTNISKGGGPSTGQTLGGLGIAALGAYGASQS